MKIFESVTIIGVGLLGGSLGLALKERRLAKKIIGIGHRWISLNIALEKNIIDEAYTELTPAVCATELLVICTPANSVPKILDKIRPHLSDTTVVTDVASTKALICEHAHDTWPKPLRFIGSHPIAGSEKYGVEHASVNLYNRSTVIIEKQTEEHDPHGHKIVKEMWQNLGANVIAMEPKIHDQVLARTSHIPHIIAACLALLASKNENSRHVVGGGFRDTTRIAAGRPELWRDICLTNRKAIQEGITELKAFLERIDELISNADEKGLENFFQTAREARARVLGE